MKAKEMKFFIKLLLWVNRKEIRDLEKEIEVTKKRIVELEKKVLK